MKGITKQMGPFAVQTRAASSELTESKGQALPFLSPWTQLSLRNPISSLELCHFAIKNISVQVLVNLRIG